MEQGMVIPQPVLSLQKGMDVMMKKMMLALAALALCGTASAASMVWQWTTATEVNLSASDYRMVASDVELSAAEAALAVDPTYDGPGVDGATAPSSESVTVVSGLFATHDDADGIFTNTVVYDSRVGTPIDFSGEGKYVYLVALNTQGEQNATFAVFSAGRVTETMVDGSNPDGYFPTFGPDASNELEWVDGTYKDVLPTNIPEPTALALLALGVAGVALRRRVA